MLLDGGGIIFKDEYLQQGEQGGHDAAKKLYSTLQDYVSCNFPAINCPRVITKMYVNVKGLSELCVRGGVTTEPSLIEDFVRGFNASYPLFDLVDIGAGKESAHDKIGGMSSETFVCWVADTDRCSPRFSRSFQTKFIQLSLPPDIPGLLAGWRLCSNFGRHTGR